jgi:signal transduction histidine kinase
MKQVLINLLMNAVQASPAGKEVKLRCYCRGEALSIDIIDRGYGIRREQKDEIFSPFFTTKKGGTGLGLPIVKKIVETHGGEVTHLENPGGGTIFRVQIPLDG